MSKSMSSEDIREAINDVLGRYGPFDVRENAFITLFIRKTAGKSRGESGRRPAFGLYQFHKPWHGAQGAKKAYYTAGRAGQTPKNGSSRLAALFVADYCSILA